MNHNKRLPDMTNIVIFPFNKEIHSIASNEDLLHYNVIGYFDVLNSPYVNKTINDILPYTQNTKKIELISNLNWESKAFDTIVCGHCGLLSHLLKRELHAEIIQKCIQFGKKLYAFDNLSCHIKELPASEQERFYFPIVDASDIPPFRFDKLRLSSVYSRYFWYKLTARKIHVTIDLTPTSPGAWHKSRSVGNGTKQSTFWI